VVLVVLSRFSWGWRAVGGSPGAESEMFLGLSRDGEG
jgi:hypothetical protein